MPRDLFAQSLTPPHAPRRSGWTIAGSILAHVGVIAVLLILPVVSAFDSFVLRANDVLQFSLPAMVVPPTPPPPAAAATRTLAPDINVNAAPISQPEHPVTAEVPLPPPGGLVGVPGGAGTGPTSPIVGGLGNDNVLAPPPPVALPPGPVRPGGDIKPPSRIAYTAPSYPVAARAARIEGTVYLEATIDTNGIVRDLKVLRSVPLLDEAAKAAVSQWRYTPTKLNGVAVPVILTVTVTFTMR